MSIMTNKDGSITFISDADPTVTQNEGTGKTQAQINADYAVFQATWPLAWWQAQQQANLDLVLLTQVDDASLIRNGTLKTVTGTQFSGFKATVTNNYRTLRDAIAAATTSAQVMAINVNAGWPSNP